LRTAPIPEEPARSGADPHPTDSDLKREEQAILREAVERENDAIGEAELRYGLAIRGFCRIG